MSCHKIKHPPKLCFYDFKIPLGLFKWIIPGEEETLAIDIAEVRLFKLTPEDGKFLLKSY